MTTLKRTILGLDISTSITGATVVQEGKILEALYWDTRNKNKFPDHFHKARFIKEKIEEIKTNFAITSVFIEKPFMFFNSGGSTAKTMSALQSFNGMISWICSDTLSIDPKYLMATEARKQAGVGIKRGDNAKEKVLQFILDNHPDIEIEYTKHGNPKPGMLDMCDSIIIALAGDKIVREEGNT